MRIREIMILLYSIQTTSTRQRKNIVDTNRFLNKMAFYPFYNEDVLSVEFFLRTTFFQNSLKYLQSLTLSSMKSDIF